MFINECFEIINYFIQNSIIPINQAFKIYSVYIDYVI